MFHDKKGFDICTRSDYVNICWLKGVRFMIGKSLIFVHVDYVNICLIVVHVLITCIFAG